MKAKRRSTAMLATKIAAAVTMAAALLFWLLAPVVGADEPLGRIGLRVMGQQELLSDSTASLRVVVTDHLKQAPVPGALVSVRLARATGGVSELLFLGRTDALGTVRAEFEVPDVEAGEYKLIVHARAGELREKVTQQVRIRRAFQILLTTDKPIYQPTQTMHLRALALRLPRLTAAAGEQVTLEVSDAKGNKVFKMTEQANDFGIVAADFVLADEVNMGRYKVKALLGDDDAEKTVTVKRYVLPKFKVTIETDRDYYLPGQHVEGTVQADYFFGKPVAEGKVTVTVRTFDFEFKDLATIEGVTDAQGSFSFEADLPSSFVGQPVEQGQAFLQFEAGVTDQAEHTETAIATSTVAAADLAINAVPESGNLVPGVDNVVFVMVSRPTGEPAQARVSLRAVTWPDGTQDMLALPSQSTDDLGIAQFTLPAAFTAKLQSEELAQAPAGLRRMAAFMAQQPGGGGQSGASVTINAIARAADGAEVRKDLTLSADPSAPEASLLLRTDRALYQVGDRLAATALTGAGAGTVYFDLIKDRQTMLTQAARIEGGRATTEIVLGPQVGGTAWISAYVITPLGQIVRDQRPIYVDPAADLAIDISADQETYAPGSEAQLAFTVRDAAGRPVAAALGINVVDESVFALQELQPGMEKVYFFLEQELMKPRYEIHGFEMPSIITQEPLVRPAALERKDRAAQIIFASIEAPQLSSFEVDTYAERLAEAKQAWLEKLSPQVERIQQALQQYQNKHDKYPPVEGGVALLVREGFLKEADLKDLWGREMLVEPGEADTTELRWIVVISLGPDGRRDTMDDLVMPGYQPMAMVHAGGFGGGRGGPGRGVRALALGAPMAMEEGRADEMDGAKAGEPETTAAAPDKESVRVRKYFPETMFFEPALITGPDGRATLTMPMADSITTWRMACLANSATGQLGSTTTGLRCFQDFFVDIDLPVALTQSDIVSIPVAVYNYLPQEQTVRLELTREPWFDLSGEDTVEMKIASNDVDVRYFTIKATRIGDHELTVHGLGPQMSDAISRKIRVEPDGRKIEETVSDRLAGNVEHTLNIPDAALDDASNILVKIYPGIFSQVVEGLDSMLRMPFGCFEQTTACTYPNILVLDYMRTTGQVTPEIDMKAAGLINTGYQRMISYECPGHGFSWFGDEPANKMLTAHGLMAFFDMQSVHNVDASIISRTQQWLLDQQEADGSWKPEEHYLHQETWTRIQNSDLLPTAYATWALAATECKAEGVKKGVAYVRKHWEQAQEPYSLAICCNALVAADKVLQEGDLDDATIEALDSLIGMAKTEGEKTWWESKITGITHSSGDSADLEATGYAGLALLTSGRYPGPTTQVINYLISRKDPSGTWYSTQATILALKVLLLSQGKATQEINAEIEIIVNGQRASAFALTPENADVMRLVDCKQLVKKGANTLTISFGGKGSCLYQVVSRYYVPWRKPDVPTAKEPLDIDVRYDRTKLAKDDILTASVTVANNTPATTSMIIVDLGVPPGFSVESGDLAELVDMDKIQKFKLTGRQIIVYFEKLEPRQVVEFSYRLRAKFPIKAKTPKSTVYEYYNPENRADAVPVEIEVTG